MQPLQTTADRRSGLLPPGHVMGESLASSEVTTSPDARDDLAPLVAVAAALDLDDDRAGACLREEAHRVTSRLVAAGRLPGHLRVALDDPLVVVLRALATAWQRSRSA